MNSMDALGMSYFEVMSTMDINLSTCLTVVQFWITATFALIIAFHFAGIRLTRSMTSVVMSLYITYSIVVIAAFIQSAQAFVYWANVSDSHAVAANVVSQSQINTAALARNTVLIFAALVMIAGTLATAYYGIHVRRSEPSDEPLPAPTGDDEGKD